MTIKQDIRNVLNFYKLKKDLDNFRENNAEICSVVDYYENYINILDFKPTTSCFYVGPEPQFRIDQCVNVHKDGSINRECCSKCSKSNFKTIQRFAEKARLLEEAKHNLPVVVKSVLSVLSSLKTCLK